MPGKMRQSNDGLELARGPLLTGRQRRKNVTRKGEFQALVKRRLYFCSPSSAIDIIKLRDYLEGTSSKTGWEYNIIGEVLKISCHKTQYKNRRDRSNYSRNQFQAEEILPNVKNSKSSDSEKDDYFNNAMLDMPSYFDQELFVFEFGSAVFWGFERGQETNLLKTIKMFSFKNIFVQHEFQKGEDDLGYFLSPDASNISISNDVIILPESTSAKQRLALSYAIAQSTILSIFEARIDTKMEQYRHIPERLAEHGSMEISSRVLNRMIGEIFVVRHEVNLHSDILDAPDFFWEEKKYEVEYNIMWGYLEMASRVDLLNKRVNFQLDSMPIFHNSESTQQFIILTSSSSLLILQIDLLRELLEVLQHQMVNRHGDFQGQIIVWTIVLYVVIEVIAVAFGYFP